MFLFLFRSSFTFSKCALKPQRKVWENLPPTAIRPLSMWFPHFHLFISIKTLPSSLLFSPPLYQKLRAFNAHRVNKEERGGGELDRPWENSKSTEEIKRTLSFLFWDKGCSLLGLVDRKKTTELLIIFPTLLPSSCILCSPWFTTAVLFFSPWFPSQYVFFSSIALSIITLLFFNSLCGVSACYYDR